MNERITVQEVRARQNQLLLNLVTVPPEVAQIRADLTPADLADHGWWILPHAVTLPSPAARRRTDLTWTAARWNLAGGVQYAGEFNSLATLLRYVRTNKIAKLPWTEGFDTT